MISQTPTDLLRAVARFHPDGRPVSRNTAHVMQYRQDQQDQQDQAAATGGAQKGGVAGRVFFGWLRRAFAPHLSRADI